jgi:RNA polymerase sigma-B factor
MTDPRPHAARDTASEDAGHGSGENHSPRPVPALSWHGCHDTADIVRHPRRDAWQGGSDRGPAASRPKALDTGELVRRWRDERDQAARQELCERYLPLARRLAARYRNSHDPFEDLVQVASVGLLGAIERFDPDRGLSFGSFAVPTILGELKRYFRNTGWSAHVPRGAKEMALRVDRASRDITASTGHAPRVEHLAEYLELSAVDVLIGLEAGTAHYSDSLDAPTAGSDTAEAHSLIDTLGTEDPRLNLVDTKLSLMSAITRLPYLERQAVMLRVNSDMKQTEIARELGCSQMQVSRLLRRAAVRVRDLTDPALTKTAAVG